MTLSLQKLFLKILDPQKRTPHHRVVDAAPPLYRLIRSRHITYTKPLASTIRRPQQSMWKGHTQPTYHPYGAVRPRRPRRIRAGLLHHSQCHYLNHAAPPAYRRHTNETSIFLRKNILKNFFEDFFVNSSKLFAHTYPSPPTLCFSPKKSLMRNQHGGDADLTWQFKGHVICVF